MQVCKERDKGGIMNVIDKARVPIKVWAPIQEVESAAIEQLTNTANLPCVFKHVAVMPDVHLGKGATVGSVVATKGAVIPAAVGVDIGCGMIAAKLPFTSKALPDSLKGLRADIERGVPVGFNQHGRPVERSLAWFGWQGFTDVVPVQIHDRFEKAQCQVGTLGGGNHFIEICLDTNDGVWVVLHSGSRNIGKEIAEVFIDQARNDMKAYFIKLPDPDLAYLVEGTTAFQAYWNALQWAQDYAFVNRLAMMDAVLKSVMTQVLNGDWRNPVVPELVINCHHNYAEREHHFGENVIVTRKGAVRARKRDYGIIPGSMGTRSYIVKGLGNQESFCSCSHGAGRRMSRGMAKSQFTVGDMEEQTRGVECRKDAGVIDEIPGAYKDIDQVMDNQKDLIEVVAELKQVLCVKG